MKMSSWVTSSTAKPLTELISVIIQAHWLVLVHHTGNRFSTSISSNSSIIRSLSVAIVFSSPNSKQRRRNSTQENRNAPPPTSVSAEYLQSNADRYAEVKMVTTASVKCVAYVDLHRSRCDRSLLCTHTFEWSAHTLRGTAWTSHQYQIAWGLIYKACVRSDWS